MIKTIGIFLFASGANLLIVGITGWLPSIERKVEFHDKFGRGIKIQRLGLNGWKDTGQEVPLASRENKRAEN